ncbi:MAG TPA: hypothetical protein VGF67_24775 [Ktedonobacteraceae bacterium]
MTRKETLSSRDQERTYAKQITRRGTLEIRDGRASISLSVRDGMDPAGENIRWSNLIRGPPVTDGRTADRSSPFSEENVPEGSFSVADPGSFTLDRIVRRRAAGCDTLIRPHSRTAFFPTEGQRLQLQSVLPQRLRAQAIRRQKFVSEQALERCTWLLLLTDAPAKRLSLHLEAIRSH